MKTRSKAVLGVAIATLLGGATVAGISIADHRDHDWPHAAWHDDDDDDGYGEHDDDRWAQQLFARLDGNDDGALTQEEISQGRAARLKEFDADGDGRLSLTEYQALWLHDERSRMVDRFQSLDDDGDAAVTVAEFNAPYDDLVRRVDENDDGTLSLHELRED